MQRSLPGCRISLSDYDNEKSETIISVTVEPGRIQIGEIPQEEDLRELADIKTITQVSLPSTSTDQSLEIISQLDALVSLSLHNNGKITNDGIAHLVSLQDLKQLSLFRCGGIDDACLDHLAKMTSLRNLNLSQTRISKRGMQSLRDRLPNCKISR